MTTNLSSGSSAAPAKPWEKRHTATSQSPSDSLTSAATTQESAVSTKASQLVPPGTSTAPSSTGLRYPMESQYGAAGYGTTGYGAGGYNTGLGSTYGTTGYGVGGYNTGYGGYGGMSSYNGYGGHGSGYGGMPPRLGYNGMGMMDPNARGFGWLSSINQIVSSISQVTELLGMNAEALNFCIGSFVHFLERIGAMCSSIATMLAPRPVFPPGHPRHGEPPVTEEEEKSRKRRVRIFQFMVSLAALTLLYKGLRWLARLRLKKTPRKLLVASPPDGTERDLEHIFQRTVGI